MTDKVLEILASNGLRLRAAPAIVSGNIIDVIPTYYRLDQLDTREAHGYLWARVVYEGNDGWIATGPDLAVEISQLKDFEWMSWPTEFIYYPGRKDLAINQKFGMRKEYYSQWNLPGHEGIDFYAPHGSKLFSVADGKVIRVGDERKRKSLGGHNYGVRVYISHADGKFHSVYAHLDTRMVNLGDIVTAGQQIGTADNTGNSGGSHLHLSMKRFPKGDHGWPYNIIDPTPFMINFLRG